MDRSRYLEFVPEDMILRDYLALERTAMANERTLLAYVRTMIGVMAIGGTFIKLFEGRFFAVTGWLLICMGVFMLILGFVRYAKIEMVLTNISREDKYHDHYDWMHQLMWSLLKKLNLAKIRNH
jgi:putative membrane protein